MLDAHATYDPKRAWIACGLATFAFTICFAAWMINGVLITFLRDAGVVDWSAAQLGWLIAIPVLTGAITRLPLGMLTDKYGGRPVFTALLLLAAVPMFLVSYCTTFWEFFLASLGFGLTGGGFAVGIAYTSLWFPQKRQGLALGIFGAGNAGAALTALAAPSMLTYFTAGGENIEGWRYLPMTYAGILVATAIIFWVFTQNRMPSGAPKKTIAQQLRPLKDIRVWRFGLYYVYVFGGFVALAQWLIPYYVNVYGMTVALAGLLAALFSFPSGVIRAWGGWLSDVYGARTVMYWVLGISLICFLMLSVPMMDIYSPGEGVMSVSDGEVVEVTDSEIVLLNHLGEEERYEFETKQDELVTQEERRSGLFIFPRWQSWQEPVVEIGDTVERRELLAEGTTHIYFQANVWIFTGLVFVIGVVTGIGKAAVYKYIPQYYPNEVGVVGGMVGVIGALGGFACPIIFGYLLEWTGIWTTTWVFLFFLTLACLFWLHVSVQKLLNRREQQELAEAQASQSHASQSQTDDAPY